MAKTKQFLDIKSGDLLKNIGSKAIWPDWVPKDVQEAYRLRRLKITELEKNLKNLLGNKVLDDKIKGKINNLVREIKAVVETDPTVANYKIDKNGNIKSDLKSFYNTTKPIDAHHIKGLDKYYQPLKQLDDIDLFDLHKEAAEKGHYFGNNPKNRLSLQRSLHQGRTRQAIPSFESIHGRIDFQDLSPDQWNEYIDRIITKQPTEDIGSAGGPEGINRKRMEIPSDDFWEYGLNDDTKGRLFEMADADQALADEF